MSDPVVIKLQHPVPFGKDRIVEELSFRRGVAGDVKGVVVNRVTLDDILLVASRLCGQPLAVIEKLDADDFGPIMEIVTDFLERCLSTGRTPSPS